MITIKKAGFEDYESIKTLMVKALKEDNDAFSVTFEEYANNSEFWWSNYISPFTMLSSSEMLIAFEDDKPIGMVGLIFDTKIKKKHVASIVWFYVIKEQRGQKIGKKLMDRLLEDLKTKPHIKKLSLLVNQTQDKAMDMYKKFGFDVGGTLKQELFSQNKYYDVYIMEKII